MDAAEADIDDSPASASNMGDDPPLSEEHPRILQNETPNFIMQYYSGVIWFLQSYGWFIIIGVIALFYIKQKYSPKYENYRRRKEEQEYLDVDPEVARQRMEAMEAARRRLQEQYDAQAAKHAEETAKREEEKRKAKIEDWERHKRGEGYRSKLYKPQEAKSEEASGSNSGPAKPKKNIYRNTDYMPLGGGSSSGADSCAWRPGRRSGGGGAGGG